MVDIPKDFATAKNDALRLLKFRVRSEKEIRDKLKIKGNDPEAIELVIQFLKEKKLLDDALFAKLWVQSRIKRPFGLNRIRYELKQKGIDKNIIEEALVYAKANTNEQEMVEAIVQNKMEKMRDLPCEKAKARLLGYLLRRGFSKEIVMEVLRDVKSRGDNVPIRDV